MVERGVVAEPRNQAGEMDRGAALHLEPRKGDLRPAADGELGHDVHLVGDVGRPAVAVDDPHRSIVADVDDVADIERRRRVDGGEMNDRDRPRRLDVLADRDDHAALHQRRVEGEHRVVAVGKEAADAIGRHVEHIGERLNRHAVEPGEIGKVGPVGAVRDHDPGAIEAGERVVPPDRRQARGVGIAGKRRHGPQKRPEVGVFPGFDPPMRQAAPLELGEGGVAPLGDGTRAGEARARSRIGGGELLLRLGLDGARYGGHRVSPHAAASAKPA